MKVREYIKKIGEKRSLEDMIELGDMLAEIICSMKETHPELYEDYKMDLYEMAYGKVLTKEMAEEWVKSMTPSAKWDFDTTTLVKRQRGIDIDDVSFYSVMNMLYSDMSNVLGDGESEESLSRYIQATKDWLNDSDVAECKLYNYWKYIVN